MKSKNSIFFTDESFSGLAGKLNGGYSKIMVLADSHTQKYCYPVVKPCLPAYSLISIKPGEPEKTLQNCEKIWRNLTRLNADRDAILINLGGGVIGDIGGFAAGCFKRGIAFINLPTTLLAMVDASVGGKTGIDFDDYKNQIGLFNQPEAVFIYTGFLKTLPRRQLLSGFAEVIKHYLIADKKAFNTLAKTGLTGTDWNALVKKNIAIKKHFADNDPYEKNIRKALNFGHTVGHAVESRFLGNRPLHLMHGEAVAIGMIAESYISFKMGKLSTNELNSIVSLIKHYFKLPGLPRNAQPGILKLMGQDKKNMQNKKQLTLLDGIGGYSINNFVGDGLIMESLRYYNSIIA